MPIFEDTIQLLEQVGRPNMKSEDYTINLLATRLADVLLAMDIRAEIRHNTLIEQIELSQKANFDHFNALLEYLTTLH